MSKYTIISVALLTIFVSCISYATNLKSSKDDSKMDDSIALHLSDEYLEKEDQDKETEYQKVISEYKAYLSSIKQEVMDEIREYRKEVVRINKQKKNMFNALSREAQRYLAKEDEMKRKLPINKYGIIGR